MMRDEKWLLEAELRCLSFAGTRSNSIWATERQCEERKTRSGYRLPFQRDRDRIIHAEAFRSLMHKSQIFPSPLLSRYRTRLTHTLEVTQVARSISRRLGLNEDLTEAIALGHDLGHAPFGHMGENILQKLLKGDRLGFEHNEHSLEIVDTSEDCDTVAGIRPGMNLTLATRQGILCHTRYEEKRYPKGKDIPEAWSRLGYSSREEFERRENTDDYSLLRVLSAEAQVVDIADEIAYLTHDLEDCCRAGILRIEEVEPRELRAFMGKRRKNALNELIGGVCEASLKSIAAAERDNAASVKIEYPPKINNLVEAGKKFFDQSIFTKDGINRINKEGQHYIQKLFHHYMRHPPQGVQPIPREIAKFIARKTDQEIIHEHGTLFAPRFISGETSSRQY